MKQLPFYCLALLIYGCDNKQQPTKQIITDSLIVGKWRMAEYGGSRVNALDTISFYENGKMDYPFETGEFTYRFIASDSLVIYNYGFGEQHYKILKLSNDSLIRQLRWQRIYADSIDELANGLIEKYIRVISD